MNDYELLLPWELTCDQASLLDYLSVASPESGLFSDWSRNKKVLRTEP